MKNTFKFLGSFFLILAVAFSMISCGKDDPEKIIYTGMASVNDVYTLTINNHTSKSLLTPTDGDKYELIYNYLNDKGNKATKTSKGIVANYDPIDGIIELSTTSGSLFDVIVDGDAITRFDDIRPIVWTSFSDVSTPDYGPQILVSTTSFINVPGGRIYRTSINVINADTHIWENGNRIQLKDDKQNLHDRDYDRINIYFSSNNRPVCNIENGRLNIDIKIPNSTLEFGDAKMKLFDVDDPTVKGMIFFNGFDKITGEKEGYGIRLEKDINNDTIFVFSHGFANINGKDANGYEDDQGNKIDGFNWNDVSLEVGWNVLLRNWTNHTITNGTPTITEYFWTVHKLKYDE